MEFSNFKVSARALFAKQLFRCCLMNETHTCGASLICFLKGKDCADYLVSTAVFYAKKCFLVEAAVFSAQT